MSSKKINGKQIFNKYTKKYKKNFEPSRYEKEDNDPKFRELYEKTKEEFYSTPK